MIGGKDNQANGPAVRVLDGSAGMRTAHLRMIGRFSVGRDAQRSAFTLRCASRLTEIVSEQIFTAIAYHPSDSDRIRGPRRGLR